MIRPSARPAPLALVALMLAAPLAAQQDPGSFTLPRPTPTPTPAPAGPADERAGVAIPPRVLTSPAPAATPLPVPSASTSPSPSANPSPIIQPRPAPAPAAPPARVNAPATPLPAPAPAPAPAADSAGTAPLPAVPDDSFALPPVTGVPAPDAPVADAGAPDDAFPLPSPNAIWPLAALGTAAVALLGGGFLWWRRRRPKVLRLAAPARAPAPDEAPAPDLTRLDLTLEITGATRSLMMFTLSYRLTIANRTPRAANDLALALQLACAQHGAENGAAPGAAQQLSAVDRIGPHQSRSLTGTLQIPLTAISPLRQGRLLLFIPLVHVTLEGAGQTAIAHSFVIGTPSTAGRLHPIPLDIPPGSIPGLAAQRVAIPPAAAA